MSYKGLADFYRSKDWERFRAVVINERTGPDGVLRSELSGEPILKRYDAVLHHIIELTEENVHDVSIALNPKNVMVITFAEHNKIHDRFGDSRGKNAGFKAGWQKVYLIYGSPCSGKTTWVNKNANPDDLILDVDRIWDAICNDGRYNKVKTKSSRPSRLNSNVFAIRDLIIDMIRMRRGKWRAAWIIGGYPLRSDRDRICDLVGAEPIYIEATLDECLERCSRERPAEWEGYIRRWFETFVELSLIHI